MNVKTIEDVTATIVDGFKAQLPNGDIRRLTYDYDSHAWEDSSLEICIPDTIIRDLELVKLEGYGELIAIVKI